MTREISTPERSELRGPRWFPLWAAGAAVYNVMRVAQGIKTFDAMHLAPAEKAGCDDLWTTDDDYLRHPRQRIRLSRAQSIVELLPDSILSRA